MKAILYYSSASIELNDTCAWEIANISAAQNEVYGITGYLCFYNKYFFQYIEGDDSRVSQIMARIQADGRHNVIQTYEDQSLATRRFPHWRMRYLHFGAFPETSLEMAIAEPISPPRARLTEQERWTSLLQGTLSRISGLHKTGECVERIESWQTIH